MTILTANNLSKYFGATMIFKGATFSVGEGECASVIGRNGEGKTTLLRILAGEMEPDEGDFAVVGRRTFGYLSQDPPSFKESVLSEMLSSRKDIVDLSFRMRSLEGRMARGDGNMGALMDEYARVTGRFEALDGYGLEHKAKSILAGLGFTPDALTKEPHVLSGGERIRLALAKLLLLGPELLLLDEPTNHLDLGGVEWLEGFLRGYPGAVLLVSHDRYFIDRVAGKILELDGGELKQYTGNYSAYLVQRDLERRVQAEQFERQQALIARTTAFIKKWKATPTRKRQAVSRERMLARLHIIDKPKRDRRTMGVRFVMEFQSGDEVLEAKSISKGFPREPEGWRTLFRDFSWLVRRGDRIALVGPNGCGKTTLLRCLCGVDEEFEGEIRVGKNVVADYFSQGLLDLVDENTVLEEVRSLGLSNQEARDLLGRFLFTGEDVEKEVSILSGGERNRLALAKIMVSKANLLYLDEPTNHLDMASREALEEALLDFPGTVLLASHDRYFIDKLATHLWLWEGETVHVWKGNYSEYRAKLESGEPIEFLENLPSFALDTGRKAPVGRDAVGKRDADGRGDADGRAGSDGRRDLGRSRRTATQKSGQKRKPDPQKDAAPKEPGQAIREEIARLEAEIEALEVKRDEYLALFEDPASYEDPGSLPWKEFHRVETELAALYEKWETLADHPHVRGAGVSEKETQKNETQKSETQKSETQKSGTQKSEIQ